MWSRKRIDSVDEMQGVARRIYDALSSSPEGQTIHDLIEVAYGQSDTGGPLTARQSVGREIRRLRKIGQKQGYEIPVSGHAHHPCYRLVETTP